MKGEQSKEEIVKCIINRANGFYGYTFVCIC